MAHMLAVALLLAGSLPAAAHHTLNQASYSASGSYQRRCEYSRGCTCFSPVLPLRLRSGGKYQSGLSRPCLGPLRASGLYDDGSRRKGRLRGLVQRILRLRGVERKSGVVSPAAPPPPLERPRVPLKQGPARPAFPALLDDEEAQLGRGEWREKPPLLSGLLTWAIVRFVHARARYVDGLEVYVAAESNRRALSGNLQTVAVRFKALAMPQLQISGGANFQVTGLDLKVLLLLWRRFRAFKRPFEVSGYYVFTSADAGASPLIRNLVQAIMNASTRKLAALTDGPGATPFAEIVVQRIKIQDSRLVFEGQAVYDQLRLRVPFKARTGVGVGKKGHTVYFKDTEITWEDTVGAGLVLPIAPVQAFDVDIGDNTRIEHIKIKDNRLYLRARFVLSPIPPLIVANVTKRAAMRYDVGEKLSTSFSHLLDSMLNWKSALTMFIPRQ
jgi:hypothetical protein